MKPGTTLTEVYEKEVYKMILKIKPYVLPKRYIDYHIIVKELARIICNPEIESNDEANFFMWLYANKWVNNYSPLYCIKPQQLEDFTTTDVEFVGTTLKPVIENFILVLPKDSITTPTGGKIEWVVIHFMPFEQLHQFEKYDYRLQRQENVEFVVHAETERVVASFIDTNNYVFHEAVPLINDVIHRQPEEDIEHGHYDFARRISNLVISTYNALNEYNPTSELTSKVINTTRGFKTSAPKQTIWYPRYVPEVDRETLLNRSTSITRAHHTKRPHDRRGHTKTVWYGKGKCKSKQVYIKPTTVNY